MDKDYMERFIYELKEDVILDLSFRGGYLEEQLNCQGYTVNEYSGYYDSIIFGVRRAWVTGLITNTEFDRIINRIAKDIMKKMKPIEGSEH